MILFSAGKLIATPTRDSTGAAIANPTPVQLGVVQDVSVDLSVELVRLHGERRYPVAVGQGKGKTEIKAKYADINGAVLGSLFYGKTATAGTKGAVIDATSTIPSTPFQITVTPPVGTFVADLGVVMGGVQLTRVAASPAAGQYTVAAGVYTFNNADATKTVKISYEYGGGTTGQVFTLTNDLMGTTPTFSMLLQNSFNGQTLALKLEQCVSGKLNLPYKNDNFTLSDFEAEAFEGSNGLGWLSFF